jgi:hypothetical protein
MQGKDKDPAEVPATTEAPKSKHENPAVSALKFLLFRETERNPNTHAAAEAQKHLDALKKAED